MILADALAPAAGGSLPLKTTTLSIERTAGRVCSFLRRSTLRIPSVQALANAPRLAASGTIPAHTATLSPKRVASG